MASPPTPPVNFVQDWIVSRFDFIELITVDSLNPDLIPPSDITATAIGVRALGGKEEYRQVEIGQGVTTVTHRNVALIASDLAFVLKANDRLNFSDGSAWIVLSVASGGYGTLYQCDGCIKQVVNSV
jgi:hypothetical protein